MRGGMGVEAGGRGAAVRDDGFAFSCGSWHRVLPKCGPEKDFRQKCMPELVLTEDSVSCKGRQQTKHTHLSKNMPELVLMSESVPCTAHSTHADFSTDQTGVGFEAPETTEL